MNRPNMHIVDPHTGESSPADIQRVFESQLATATAWRESTVAERIARLKKLRDAMMARREDFYKAFQLDYRKPASEVAGIRIFRKSAWIVSLSSTMRIRLAAGNAVIVACFKF